MTDLSHVERQPGAEHRPEAHHGQLTISFSPLLHRELNGNNITRIHRNDFTGLKQLRVL